MSKHLVVLCLIVESVLHFSEPAVKGFNKNSQYDFLKHHFSKKTKNGHHGQWGNISSTEDYRDHSGPPASVEDSSEELDSDEDHRYGSSNARSGKLARLAYESEESEEDSMTYRPGSRSLGGQDLVNYEPDGPPANDVASGDPADVPPNSVWHSLVAQPLKFLYAIPEFCHCGDSWNCVCCIGIDLKIIGFKNNLCAHFTQGPDAQTNSKHMVHLTISLDTIKALDFYTSEREAPTLCGYTIPINLFRGCVRLADVVEDVPEKTTCACADFSLHFQEKAAPFIAFRYQCLCVGRPWPNSKKRLFQLGALIDLIKDVKNKLTGALAGLG